MKGLFVNKNDKVVIDLYACLNKEKSNIYISADKEALLKNNGADEETVQKHSITFRRPNYGDNVYIYGESVKMGEEGVEIKGAKLQYEKMIRLLESWTLCDEDGKVMPATRDSVLSLNPDLANLIIEELDKKI